MTSEYLFIADLKKLNSQLRPAIRDFVENGSDRALLNLIWNMIQGPRRTASHAWKLYGSRCHLALLLMEFMWQARFNRSRAIASADFEIVPEIFERLCLREIAREQTLWDFSNVDEVRRAIESSELISHTLSAPKIPVEIRFGNACHFFSSDQVEVLLTEFQRLSVGGGFREEHNPMISALKLVISCSDLALGITII